MHNTVTLMLLPGLSPVNGVSFKSFHCHVELPLGCVTAAHLFLQQVQQGVQPVVGPQVAAGQLG